MSRSKFKKALQYARASPCSSARSESQLATSVSKVKELVEALTSNKPLREALEGVNRRNMQLVDAFREVAHHSYESKIAPVIAETLWRRVLNSRGMHWRHGHKALVLLEYLLEHGSEAIAADVLDHAQHVFRLKRFSGKQKVEAVKLRAVKLFTGG